MADLTHNSNHRKPLRPTDCEQARLFLDRRDEDRTTSNEPLQKHLAECSVCAAEARTEMALRRVIAPPVLPSPSDQFEATLMERLEIQPVRRSIAQPSLLSRWGWIGPVLTLFIFLLGVLDSLGLWIYRQGLLIYADLAAKYAGRPLFADTMVTFHIPSLTPPGSYDPTLFINLMVACLFLMVTVVTVGMAQIRRF